MTMRLFRSREDHQDDQDRTGRLLDSLDAAYAHATGEITDFEDVVICATGAEVDGTPYPPPGHGYPRRRC
ncbi:hypothetical protein [Streptomyces olivaceus]|uniref:hypothetical protein n=2 Tax=Streptomyces TaxID=1883 RepID=UPI000ACE2C39|nr:hypothetical protein [Streptomyces olivaceus]MBZ6107324.1 hypothetical protein [Streptomyces olivaceus]MBZ6206373.1 hypothetical protein [Streptomyces olivaceus]